MYDGSNSGIGNASADGESIANGVFKYKILTLGSLSDNDRRDEKQYEYNPYAIGKPVEIIDGNDQKQSGRISKIIRDVNAKVLKIYFISDRDAKIYPAYPYQVQQNDVANKFPTSAINTIGEIPVGTTMPTATMNELKSPSEFRRLYEADNSESDKKQVTPQELEWDYWKSNLDSQYPILKSVPEMEDHLLEILKCKDVDLVAMFDSEFGYSYLKSLLKEPPKTESLTYHNEKDPVIFNTYELDNVKYVELIIKDENATIIFTKYTPNMTLVTGN